MELQQFIEQWSRSGGAELANTQSFLRDLCDLLELEHPQPTVADEACNTYTFEKAVTFNNGDGTTSPGRIDLYRKGCFVLESKQGTEKQEAEQEVLSSATRKKKFRAGTAQRGTPGWERAMTKARKQAEGYAKALPDEWPPFLIVIDVGYCFDLYADFAQSGKNYIPFPDPQSYRIFLKDLEKPEVRETLRNIWLDPLSLDSTKRAAKATRELATRLAKLARSLEAQHTPDTVAHFLMRCLFTMFAEDIEVGSFPRKGFQRFLEQRRGKLDTLVPMLEALWKTMDTGGFSVILEQHIKQFNGGLFEDQTALPLNEDQLELLIEAASADWKDVEPAIFGTLLERALDPVERHKLGAHYTPRAYVERLVMPTIIEPLREEWDTVYASAVKLYEDGETDDAVAAVRAFHGRLCETRVLDPACGSGNFLYVSLELMKRLEGEVLNTLREFGDRQQVLLTVDPHQFLGIEVNPRAAAITDLVLWIGYLQWHFRTRGSDPLNEPIIRKFHNIECRDAVLAWDAIEPVFDEQGNPVTRWDGRTTKPHPVTGEEVPDENARVQEMRYLNPRKAEWPETDYIVGNPPYIGTKRMRLSLGDGYVQALRTTYSDSIEDNADYVMYWWWHSGIALLESNLNRFGLITTNSIGQSFNRRAVDTLINRGVYIIWAIPDHPWTDEATGADVRIAMTVAATFAEEPTLCELESVPDTSLAGIRCRTVARIHSSLRSGANLALAQPLLANRRLCAFGMALHGAGFVLTAEEANELRSESGNSVVRPYLGGRDLLQTRRIRFVIDFSGLVESEARKLNPQAFQRLIDRVYPERMENRRKSIRELWWRFGWERPELRKALQHQNRYVATTETSKHRIFQFVEANTVPDHMVVVFATDDAFHLGVVSSEIHVVWALAAGGRLGVGNDPRYNKTKCFDPFPFPDPDDVIKQRIRDLGEQLDAHRKRQQELHPKLTMTGIYNVLEKLRSGEELTTKEKTIHEQGLVSVLKQIHDDLDAAVFDAYGWPHDLTDEEILQRLVDLNHERAEEEKRGLIRWLRPDFQNPQGDQKAQQKLDIRETDEAPAKKPAAKPKKSPWPSTLPERIKAVRQTLTAQSSPSSAADVARQFTRAKKDVVEELLETLVAVGQARQTEDGKYVA